MSRARPDILAGERSHYRAFFETVPQGMCVIRLVFDDEGRANDYIFVETNGAFVAQTGLEDVVGKSMRALAPDHEESWFEIYGEIARTGIPRRFEQRAEALGRLYSVYAFRLGDPAERLVGVLFDDILEKVEVQEQLRASEARLRFLDRLGEAVAFQSDADDILRITTQMVAEHMQLSNCAYADMDEDEDGFTIRGDWATPGSPSIVGHYRLTDFGEKAVAELGAGRPLIINDNLAEIAPHEAQTFQDIGIAATICMPLIKDGRLLALMAIHDKTPHYWTEDELVTIREVTQRSWAHVERAGAAAEIRKLATALEQRVEERTTQLTAAEAALRQSQKMEAVGQLTGGLAHDFNNLLAGISGSLELIALRVRQQRYSELDRYFSAADVAIKSAAALTHRLLAFSRRQALDPKPTDINQLIWGMEELIKRTAGPAIDVEVTTAPDIWPILVDRHQLENALLNLCINARDAMPDGGRLTIVTANDAIDGEQAIAADMPPGDYVSMCVIDTGEGMTADVIAKAFDPFFTTKPLGQGTGLGLSMTYGFARQSGGQVRIESSLGEGATLHIFLPRYSGELPRSEAPPVIAGTDASGGGEVVLLIDDEPAIRMLLTEVLTDAGYNVIEAADGPTGLRLLEATEAVDLLITDVGLPGGIDGLQVAQLGKKQRPDLKVLLITGYAERAALSNTPLSTGMSILAKPFEMMMLTTKIRTLLDAEQPQKTALPG